MLLAKFRLRHRDPNLFYVTMEVVVRGPGGGAPARRLLVLDDHACPAELQQCRPRGEARFSVGVRRGGLLRVHDSILMPGVSAASGLQEESSTLKIGILFLSPVAQEGLFMFLSFPFPVAVQVAAGVVPHDGGGAGAAAPQLLQQQGEPQELRGARGQQEPVHRPAARGRRVPAAGAERVAAGLPPQLRLRPAQKHVTQRLPQSEGKDNSFRFSTPFILMSVPGTVRFLCVLYLMWCCHLPCRRRGDTA